MMKRKKIAEAFSWLTGGPVAISDKIRQAVIVNVNMLFRAVVRAMV